MEVNHGLHGYHRYNFVVGHSCFVVLRLSVSSVQSVVFFSPFCEQTWISRIKLRRRISVNISVHSRLPRRNDVKAGEFVIPGNQLDGELRRSDKGTVGKRRMMRLYLIGMLCGVMITAAVTYAFALPANTNYWRMEIWKRGGAAWTVDQNGHIGWKWMVEPIPDTPSPAKRAVAPPPRSVHSERL